MSKNEKWIDWAIELQSLAQAGLYYSKDKFDLERYERIREITAEMLSYKTDIEDDKRTIIMDEKDLDSCGKEPTEFFKLLETRLHEKNIEY